MKSLNELLLEQGYRIYMCSVDRRYVSFVQEENYSINVICIYDERSQTSTRAQMESFLTVHRERLSYGRDKDIHFLKLLCTTERGVGMILPGTDPPGVAAGNLQAAYGDRRTGDSPAAVPVTRSEQSAYEGPGSGNGKDPETDGTGRSFMSGEHISSGQEPDPGLRNNDGTDTSWIDDVWYLIDDSYTQGWRLFVPQAAMPDFYGLRAHLERHIVQNGVEIALPEISEALASQTRASIEKLPMTKDAAKQKLRESAAKANAEAPWVTLALVIVCAIMYFLQGRSVFSVDDYVIETGILSDPSQWYRLLTSVFLHGSPEHLINNMLVLYAVGSFMEPRLGRVIYTTVYLVSGIGGGIFSVWYHTARGQDYQALGASGAVYGLIAAMIAYMLLHREFRSVQYYTRIGIALILLFYSGRTETGIDTYAHIGGFVSGLIVAGLLCIVTWTGMHRRKNA